MEAVFLVVGGAGGLAAGLLGGLWWGARVKGRGSWAYWLLNVLVIAIGIGGNFAGLVTDQFWLAVASIAFIGGGLTGLKYGYGRSVGLWRVHDRMMKSDDLPH